MQKRDAERRPVGRWRWVVAVVLLAVGIWALYTFWYTPGITRQAQHASPAAERSR